MPIPFSTRLRYVAAKLFGGYGRPQRTGAAIFGAERRDALGTFYRPFRVFSRDGLALAGRDYGGRAAPVGPPLLCVPGLSRNSRDFEPVARHFADRGVRVVTVDLRGRGASDWDDDATNYNPITESGDVLTMMDALGLTKPLLVGTSRGGIVAMVAASLRPSPFAGVVLNDIGPVVELDGLLKIKVYIGRTEPPRDWAGRRRLGRSARGADLSEARPARARTAGAAGVPRCRGTAGGGLRSEARRRAGVPDAADADAAALAAVRDARRHAAPGAARRQLGHSVARDGGADGCRRTPA